MIGLLPAILKRCRLALLEVINPSGGPRAAVAVFREDLEMIKILAVCCKHLCAGKLNLRTMLILRVLWWDVA